MAIATSGRPRNIPGAVARVACFALTATWHNTPNLITLARLGCIPVLLLLLAEEAYDAAFYLFLAAAASDALDGFLAKRFTGVSAVGAVLDPVADKLLMVGLLAALAQLGVLPLWLFLLTLARDLLMVAGVAILRLLAVPGFRVAPHPVGKLCTFLQLVLGAFALASLAFLPGAAVALPPLVVLVALLTVASAAFYVVEALRLTLPGRAAGRA